MGKRKRVKENTNMNGSEENPVSTSSSAMEMSREGNETTDNKIEGGNSSKKVKRGESSNSGVGTEAGAGQSQESIGNKTSMDNSPPEKANGNAEPSSSTSFGKTSQKEAPSSETGQLELTIKRKVNEAADKDEVFTEWPIKDLPPEMLTEILKNLENRRLFYCRLVSRQWLEISTKMLTSRTDSILSFQANDVKQVTGRHYRPENTPTNKLHDFLQSIKTSNNCPYTRFSFYVDAPAFFNNKNWIEFLSVFGPSHRNQNQKIKMKCLQLKCYSLDNTKKWQLFTERLRDLLVKKIPRLEEISLVLYIPRDTEVSSRQTKKIQLFPLETKTTTTTTTSRKKPTVPVPVQLPYLKSITIESEMFVPFLGIVRDLLKAAVNLTRLYVGDSSSYKGSSSSRLFQLLHSVGKLHLLQEISIDVNKDFVYSLKKTSSTQSQNPNQNQPSTADFALEFKVHELQLYSSIDEIDPPFYADGTNFISNLLESSKDTLEKLEMQPFGFLDGLQFPKFTKLRTVELYLYRDAYGPVVNDFEGQKQFFPRGIRSISMSRGIFPTVHHLEIMGLDWESAFPHEDSIPIFPSVYKYWFSDDGVKDNMISKLGLMCPNLKHLQIEAMRRPGPAQFSFPRFGRSIWTHLKQLESLEVDVDVNLENHAFPALDSCFTGISTESCQRLQELMEAEKTRNENLSSMKLTESEEIMKLTQREHPSILDLKNLKKLVINTQVETKPCQGDNFFTTKITWISEEFAFKLMPHLEFNGRKPSASS